MRPAPRAGQTALHGDSEGNRQKRVRSASSPWPECIPLGETEKIASDDSLESSLAEKVAPGTRYVRYRCSLPGLAGFTAVASPGTINVTQSVAEGEGFEPSVPFSTHDFQSCTFGHSVIPPERRRSRTGRDLNPRCFRTSDFESDTIGHSDTPPETSGSSDRAGARQRKRTARPHTRPRRHHR